MTGFDERIKLGLFNGKLIGTILGNIDRVTFGIDVGTELGSLDGSFGVSNDGKFDILSL